MFNVSIRGATTVENNTRGEILEAAKELLEEIFHQNDIRVEDVSSVIFTATADITKVYPAVAAREIGLTSAALMCVQEMAVEDSMEKCIRVMISLQSAKPQAELCHVYLRRAVSLRPDLASKPLCIAIDGPVGSGKSTVARMAAQELGFIYVDTGSMYRAVALYCMRLGIDTRDEAAVSEALPDIKIDIRQSGEGQEILLNGENVTALVRTQEVADGSSRVAVIPAVREKLTRLQQEMARNVSVVMDGRDIGTKVLPHAQVKIYLEASAEVRTRRRMGELQIKGLPNHYDTILEEIRERDYRDTNRAHAPLKKAEDAIVIDTSDMNQLQVKDAILEILKKKGLRT